MRVAAVLVGLFALGLVLPDYGMLLVPLYLSFWVLRPFTPRPVVTRPRRASVPSVIPRAASALV
jgi:hypothetical protein